MVATLYQRDPRTILHRGTIFQYRPIFWLDPPLWILRNHRWTPPRSANIYAPSELRDAFRRGAEDNQEDVIARAKVRYIVILSNGVEALRPQFKEVIVTPIYTVDPRAHRPNFLEALRHGKYPDLFYLPADPAFPQMVESYVDFRKVQALSKGSLLQRTHLAQKTLQAINEAFHIGQSAFQAQLGIGSDVFFHSRIPSLLILW